MPDPLAEFSLPDLPEGPGKTLAESLNNLSPELRAELRAISHDRHVPQGTVVVAQGSDTGEVGFIVHGTLAMRRLMPDDRDHVIGLLVPTEIFGRLFDGPSSYDLVALNDTRLIIFERTAFEDIMRRTPEIERIFLVSLLDELDAAREWFMMLSGRKVLERVASFLLILLRRHLKTGPDGAGPGMHVVELPLGRSDLSHYLGIRPETLSRSLHNLQKRGVLRIRAPYVLEILDIKKLAAASFPDDVID